MIDKGFNHLAHEMCGMHTLNILQCFQIYQQRQHISCSQGSSKKHQEGKYIAQGSTSACKVTKIRPARGLQPTVYAMNKRCGLCLTKKSTNQAVLFAQISENHLPHWHLQEFCKGELDTSSHTDVAVIVSSKHTNRQLQIPGYSSHR